MKAELLDRQRIDLDEESFIELRIWKLPRPLRGSRHPYKYSLVYVEKDVCVLRYDNEAGKGDHIHQGKRGRPYNFTTAVQLKADFLAAVQKIRRSK